MIEAHVQAVVDLLEAADLAVFRADARAHDGYPYVVLFTDTGRRYGDRLGGGSGELTVLVQITSVGVDDWQAKWAADTARDALIDVRPSVEGRFCERIKQELSRPVERDDDKPDVPLFYAIDQYRLRSTAA